MTVNRRKKNVKQRGTTWHGWGRGAAHHKGAGNRGGRGMAGTGKKAGTRQPSVWNPRRYGKVGFTMKGPKKKINAVNLEVIGKMVEKGKIKNDINLKDLGFNKLLGKGKGIKLKITVDEASSKAVEKVKTAGGEVILSAKKE